MAKCSGKPVAKAPAGKGEKALPPWLAGKQPAPAGKAGKETKKK